MNICNYIFKYKKIPFVIFWVVLSLIYAGIYITIDLNDSPFSGFSGFLNISMQWMVLCFVSSGLLSLASVNRYIFAFLFPLLIIVSSIIAYFKLSMGLVFTPACIELAFINDVNTCLSVISWKLIALVIISLVVSILIVIARFKYVKINNTWIFIFMGLAIVSVPFVVKRFYGAVINRLPYSIIYNIKSYIDNRNIIEEERSTFDNISVKAGNNPPDVIFVLGESLRADHVSMNGYSRQTFPNISCDTSVVSFPNVYSEPYFTHTSVPRIMTRADEYDPDIAYSEPSFISLFKKAGYKTIWLSNQDIVSTYAYFMHEADSLIYGNAAKSTYCFDKWYDSDLLPHYSKLLKNKDDKPRLIVIHSIGSHWWYKSHYPDSLAVFKPEIDSRVISDLSREQIINSYDNTILATDIFLWKVIELLRNRNAFLLYVSDHGEALGEDGNYLHANDYEQLHNPAMFVWTSEKYEQLLPDKVKSLRHNKNIKLSTDWIFHSVLDGAELSTDVKNDSLSIFSYEKN